MVFKCWRLDLGIIMFPLCQSCTETSINSVLLRCQSVEFSMKFVVLLKEWMFGLMVSANLCVISWLWFNLCYLEQDINWSQYRQKWPLIKWNFENWYFFMFCALYKPPNNLYSGVMSRTFNSHLNHNPIEYVIPSICIWWDVDST